MLRTVQFNDQFLRFAVEIDNIGWNRMLAAEFQTAQPTGSQAIPEQPLGIGACLPQFAR
jgi:hypothetical protein